MHVPDLITAQVCSRTNYVAVLLVVSPHTFTKSSYYKKKIYIYICKWFLHTPSLNILCCTECTNPGKCITGLANVIVMWQEMQK